MKTTGFNQENATIENMENRVEQIKAVYRPLARGGDWDEETENTVRHMIQQQQASGWWSLLPAGAQAESDVRVDFMYMPTYLLSAILMMAVLKTPALANDPVIMEALGRGLNASCGRSLFGHGYDSYRGFLESVRLFIEAKTSAFIKTYPDISPRFAALWKTVPGTLMLGAARHRDWTYDDQTKRESIRLIDAFAAKSDFHLKPSEAFYFAYGSNMSEAQIEKRCPYARFISAALLPDYQLSFRKSSSAYYASVDKAMGSHVPVIVWALTPNDFEKLDRCEGVGNPECYVREKATVLVGSKKVSGEIYVLSEARPFGKPESKYTDTMLAAYAAFGFPVRIIDDALNYAESQRQSSNN